HQPFNLKHLLLLYIHHRIAALKASCEILDISRGHSKNCPLAILLDSENLIG
ncbi:hypothetical protein HispidOSU_025412, partial [Sigmodon hispidus]